MFRDSRGWFAVCAAVTALMMLAAGTSRAQAEARLTPDSGEAVYHDTSPPLASLTPSASSTESTEEGPALRETPLLPSESTNIYAPDTSGALLGPSQMPSPTVNFKGIGTGCLCRRPDPSGAAGTTQYMEIVNKKYDIYSKSGVPLLEYPVPTNTLWKDFGPERPCEKNNSGDATVLFDAVSQRWVVQQPSLVEPYADCVAISATSDATKDWYRYEFHYRQFPDYPKIGVWSTGYYVSFNMFGGEGHPEVCALDRAKMLEGEEASQQCFDGPNGANTLQPATVDGSEPPPSGEPEWLVALSPTEKNALAYWEFHVDWSDPAKSSFSGPSSIAVEPFTPLCGCVPQLGTTQKLEGLGDRLMYRLAYRNFGNHQAMVVTDSIQTENGAGMRWYELRPTEGGGLIPIRNQSRR